MKRYVDPAVPVATRPPESSESPWKSAPIAMSYTDVAGIQVSPASSRANRRSASLSGGRAVSGWAGSATGCGSALTAACFSAGDMADSWISMALRMYAA
ncbi:hypothetical protein EES45_08500 [Streptomyces sp. ADI97-07]|nr:hypothetical protein EES45_08500 [Streptomyces sp. ADI97-07]